MTELKDLVPRSPSLELSPTFCNSAWVGSQFQVLGQPQREFGGNPVTTNRLLFTGIGRCWVAANNIAVVEVESELPRSDISSM